MQDFINLLTQNGLTGLVAALFLYLWQRAEGDKKTLYKELADLRDAFDIKGEGHTKTLLELQERRITEAARMETIVVGNTAAMHANSDLLRVLVQSAPRRSRGES